MKYITLIFVAMFLGAALIASGTWVAEAETLCVNTGGTGGCYATIQAAIDASVAIDTSMQSGADRLTALQNNDGGWDWPLNDGNPASASPTNTIGPIAMGLAQAYAHTSDPDHLAALQDAGSFLLTKIYNFSPSDGYLAAKLDQIFGGTTYTDHVNTYFYGPLAAGTYNRLGLGTLYSTATYVQKIRDDRFNQGIANLAAWDVAMGLVGAASAGAGTAEWIAGVKAEIDELDGDAYYDVIGLAGAVYALALVGEEFDPTAGEHAAAGSLSDLAAILAGYQIAGGGFAWNSNYVIPDDGNETIQETAYAIMALNEVDRDGYLVEIQGAADYMGSVQLGTGGWENYTGSGENNEITAEALWGRTAVYGAEATVINVAAGTYNVGTVTVVNKPVTILGPSGGGAIVQGTTAAVPVFEITASNVTIQDLEITHSAMPPYPPPAPLPPYSELVYALMRVPINLGLSGIAITGNTIYVPAQSGAMSTWGGIAICIGSGAATGISITGNTIYNTRNGMVVQYNNTVTISNNTIYDTKGGIMNYTNNQADADNRTMSNNSWGTMWNHGDCPSFDATHNEWDIVWNTGGALFDPDYQQSVLALSVANNDAFVLDRRAADGTAEGNRSHIFVNDDSTIIAAHPARGNFNEPFKYLQLGVDAVVPGGTVYVAAGTYPEQVIIAKALTATGCDGAVLDGTGLVPTWTTGVKIKSGNVTFNNIDVTNYTQDGMVCGYDPKPLDNLQNIHITNCKVSNIQPGYWGFGIYVGYEAEGFGYSPPHLTTHLDYSGLLIEGNEITNTNCSGLVLQSITASTGALQVKNNYFHDISTNDAIWIDTARTILMENNLIENNLWGIDFTCIAEDWYTVDGPYGPKDITIQCNMIRNSTEDGIGLYNGWPGTIAIENNSIEGNTPGINNDMSATVTAENNWWGCVGGPGAGGCDAASGDVDFTPWATLVPPCVNCSDDADCDDGLACTGIETCNLDTEMCQAGVPVDCSSLNDQCNTGVCEEPAGTCAADPLPDGTVCDDGDTCSIPDQCEGGACITAGGGDTDGDGTCDFDDICPNDPNNDVDGDTVCGDIDNCPTVANTDQADADGDGFGDACDNCPINYNPGQEDNLPPGGNTVGDACECEGNFNCDADVDGSDASIFKLYFGRGQFNAPCNAFNPCRGDFDCDGDVDGTDASRFKADFGRSTIQNPCPESPTCAEPDWCSYPN